MHIMFLLMMIWSISTPKRGPNGGYAGANNPDVLMRALIDVDVYLVAK